MLAVFPFSPPLLWSRLTFREPDPTLLLTPFGFLPGNPFVHSCGSVMPVVAVLIGVLLGAFRVEQRGGFYGGEIWVG